MKQDEHNLGLWNHRVEFFVPPAWELPGELLERLWLTTWQVIWNPVRTFSAPAQPGYGPSLRYAVIVGTLGTVSQTIWDWTLSGKALDMAIVLDLIFAPLIVVAALYIGSGITHVFLLLLKGADGGYQATFRVLAYSEAAYIWLLIPKAGLYVFMVWGLLVSIGGLAAVHNISRGRVALALVLPLFAIVLLPGLLSLASALMVILSAPFKALVPGL